MSQRGETSQGGRFAGGVAAGILGTLVLLAGIGVTVVYSGAYNIAATEEHTSIMRWAFGTTFHNSVERNAADAVPPEAITPAMLESGAGHYKAMCEHCHGGPGADRAEWAAGMRPRPPHLAEAAAHWTLPQVFWLAKHGARMTGMPAFGPTHDDATLWGIAAFVKELPGMTADDYAATGALEGGHGAAHGSGGAGHEHAPQGATPSGGGTN